MATVLSVLTRARNKARRTLAKRLHRRDATIDGSVPMITFTFDDAPRSAFETGAAVLESHGARGTYFVSLGLMSTTTEIGPIGGEGELERAVADGHELGCHTFHHHDAWSTPASDYVASVDRNRATLAGLLPGYDFHSFAYPKSGATAAVKPALAKRFDCCRGGGQTYNAGTVDLNLVSACFIDQHAQIDLAFVSDLIDRNAEAGGWLVFAAHDISESSAPFACSTRLFEAIVRRSVDSGALVLPMGPACAHLHAAS